MQYDIYRYMPVSMKNSIVLLSCIFESTVYFFAGYVSQITQKQNKTHQAPMAYYRNFYVKPSLHRIFQ